MGKKRGYFPALPNRECETGPEGEKRGSKKANTVKRKYIRLTVFFVIENHAIVAWFKRG